MTSLTVVLLALQPSANIGIGIGLGWSIGFLVGAIVALILSKLRAKEEKKRKLCEGDNIESRENDDEP